MVLKSWYQQIKARHWQAFSAQKGQSIIIVTFAFLGLIAMLGLALDLGLVYIEQVRISRTTDAAALASVVELPFEEEGMRRAVEYIELNGYNVGPDGDTTVLVRGCVDPPGATGLSNVNASGPLAATAAIPITPTNKIEDGYALPEYTAGVNPPRAVFIVDTLSYQSVDFNSDGTVKTKNNESCDDSGGLALYGTANKLRVSGRVRVNMNFMQFFGFGEVPVEDEALGENVTSLDVAIVFDVSGSMDFETTCFGCWTKDSTKDPVDYPFPSNGNMNAVTYKPDDGTYASPVPANGFNIFWDNRSGPLAAGHPVCSTSPPASTVYGGQHYMVHEAEFYSHDNPTQGWQFEERTAGKGFWVVQRRPKGSNKAYIRTHSLTTYSQSSTSNYPQLQGASYNDECFKYSGGVGSLSGQCWKTRAASLGEPAPSEVPHVEYDFTPDWSGPANIWIRAIGGYIYGYEWFGASNPPELRPWQYAIYWQVNNGQIQGGPFTNLNTGGWSDVSDSDWRWLKLGSVPVTAGTQYTFKLYQGSAGFNVDKIIFTDDSTGSIGTAVSNNGTANGGSITNNFKNFVKQNGGEGPDATPGSATREACNACNPMYGQTVDLSNCSCKLGPGDTASSVFYGAGGAGVGCTSVTTTTNQLSNDLFHDIDPLRSAKEAVKNFVVRLDPKFDQVAFIPFATNVYTPREKLQCLRYAASRYTNQNYCYDQDEPGEGRPISYTRIIRAVEERGSGGSTNIAEGMREGLEELGVNVPGYINVDHDCDSYTSLSASGDGSACDRRGAARRILILMTDGSPNQSVSCGAFNWQGLYGQGLSSYNCAMYYAKQAADNSVVVYTIGIGSGVNRDLLTAMATGTDPTTGIEYFSGRGGEYYPAARPSDLDEIFDKILSNIFVRIVG